MKINIPIKKTLKAVGRAPGDLIEDTKVNIGRGLRGVGKYIGGFTGAKPSLPPDFQKQYRDMQKSQGESALDVIKRVQKGGSK